MNFDKTTATKIYNFLTKNGFTQAGAFGVIGNMYSESGLRPDNLENTYNNKLNMTDEEYTNAVDNGSYVNFVHDSAGYGLVQWTYWSRKQALLDYKNKKRVSIGNIDMQLEFFLKEITTNYRPLYTKLCTSDDVGECAIAFMLNFERPLNQTDAAQKGRVSLAKQIEEIVKPSSKSTGITKWNGIKEFTKGQRVQIAQNFVTTEFDCQGKGCCSTTPIDYNLVQILQNIRNHFGKPVNLNCGYRCPKHNSEIKGASKTSQHMSGKAADIVISGIHPMELARYIETIPGYKGMIGCYTWDDSGKGFVHVDTRGTNYRGVYTEDNAHCDYVNSFNDCISVGSRGRLVKVVQRRLQAKGMYKAAIDGTCGSETAKAITDWNEKHGRVNDGVWGPKCWNEAFPY